MRCTSLDGPSVAIESACVWPRGEEPGAVGARQDADLDADRPDRGRVAAVDPDVLAQHELTDGRLGEDVHER